MTKPTYDFENLRVLAVDDSQYMIQIVTLLLEAMGIRRIQGLERPAEVFATMKEWRPDLIIVDHIMTPITGLELIKQIRTDTDSPDQFVPIILLTGHAKTSVVKNARFNSGADAVLVKPVSAQRLYEAIVAIYKSDRTFVETKTYFGPDRRVKDRPFEGEDRRGQDTRDTVVLDDDDELVFEDADDTAKAAAG